MYNKTTLLVLCFVLSLTVVFGATNIQIKQDGGSTASVTRPFPASENNDKRFTQEIFQDGETTTASVTTVVGPKVNTVLVPVLESTGFASGTLSAGYLYMTWDTSNHKMRMMYKESSGTVWLGSYTFTVAP